MPVVTLAAFACSPDVVIARLENKFNFIDRSRGGKFPHGFHVQLYVFFLFLVVDGLTLVYDDLTIVLLVDQVGVSAGDDGRCLVASGFARNLDIELFADIFFTLDIDAFGVLYIGFACF